LALAFFMSIQLEGYGGRLMAEDGKQGTNLASGSVVLVALIAMGAFVFHKDAPLTGSRPAITEANVRERAKSQTVDARLWQDPFAAVAKAIDRLAKQTRPAMPQDRKLRKIVQPTLNGGGKKRIGDRRHLKRRSLC
jgi:membrane-bound lytic murein transglycosylase B